MTLGNSAASLVAIIVSAIIGCATSEEMTNDYTVYEKSGVIYYDFKGRGRGQVPSPRDAARSASFVVSDTVIEQTDTGRQVRAFLESFVKERADMKAILEGRIAAMQDYLQRMGNKLSERERRDREQELQKAVLDYQGRAKEWEQEAKDKVQLVSRAFRGVAVTVAKSKGLPVLIEVRKDASTGALPDFYDRSRDITDLVSAAFAKLRLEDLGLRESVKTSATR